MPTSQTVRQCQNYLNSKLNKATRKEIQDNFTNEYKLITSRAFANQIQQHFKKITCHDKVSFQGLYIWFNIDTQSNKQYASKNRLNMCRMITFVDVENDLLTHSNIDN